MKPALTLLLTCLALSQCTTSRPTTPQARDSGLIQERWEGRERERAAFEDGSADGSADAASGAVRNYGAHPGQYDPHTEHAYREGYNDAFDKAAPDGHPKKLSTAPQAAHDAGYNAGVHDRRMGRGADPDQYAGTYEVKWANWFMDGYHEGFEGR